MKKYIVNSNSVYFKVILFCIIILLSGILNVNAQKGELMIIANSKGTPVEVKYPELKSVLKGERQQWKDGTKVVIALMKSDTPTGISTSSKIYNMTPDQLSRFWVNLVFAGKANAPRFFDRFEDLESFVIKTPGAIGVVEANEQSFLNPVLVDGKKSF